MPSPYCQLQNFDGSLDLPALACLAMHSFFTNSETYKCMYNDSHNLGREELVDRCDPSIRLTVVRVGIQNGQLRIHTR